MIPAATATNLLVVCDFDGTLAGFCADPQAVVAHPDALTALQDLSRAANTRVVVLSGRSFTSLSSVCPLVPPVRLVGSHGAEDGAPAQLPPETKAAFSTLNKQLRALCADVPGAWVEEKPLHHVLHVRPVADEAVAQRLLDTAAELGDGFTVTPGNKVLEFGLSKTTKGEWIETHRQPGETVLFIGDDTTDETAFKILQPTDTGIKVGSGPTAARMRVADIDDVALALQQVRDART